MLTRLHHRIEYSQQLSHAGRQRQLLRLPCRQQPLVKGLMHDNDFCRPVASSGNVTVIFAALIVAHGVMSPGSASFISLCSAEAYTNCFATTMRHWRTLR